MLIRLIPILVLSAPRDRLHAIRTVKATVRYTPSTELSTTRTAPNAWLTQRPRCGRWRAWSPSDKFGRWMPRTSSYGMGYGRCYLTIGRDIVIRNRQVRVARRTCDDSRPERTVAKFIKQDSLPRAWTFAVRNVSHWESTG